MLAGGFAMIAPVLFIAERLVRHGARPSAKTLISLVAAATIQLMCTHWESFDLTYEPKRASL